MIHDEILYLIKKSLRIAISEFIRVLIKKELFFMIIRIR